MTDLTDFLLARIAEDEAVARALSWESDPEWPEMTWLQEWTSDADAIRGDQPWQFLRRFDPARVLAECEAKRWIVEAHGPDVPVCGWTQDSNTAHRDEPPCLTLRLLALPYADHPDYREEWKP